MSRRVRSTAAAVPALCLLAACGVIGPSESGVPCGGAQYASARVVLPDTGVNGGTTVHVGLVQHDPQISGELAEVVVQHVWPAERGENPAADPRVRLVRDDGRVLLDTLGTRLDQPSGTFTRRTWFVLQWIRSAEQRQALFGAFRDGTLWLELWAPGAGAPRTRVPVRAEQIGVTPPTRCL
jgi:hypothetical protein